MSSQMRKLIPDEQIIVVLDTGPVRDITHLETPPGWAATFEKMSHDGYSFSLADNALAELLAQYIRGAFDRAALDKILAAISPFLNPEMPIMLGKKDVSAMAGDPRDASWNENDARHLSKRGWEVLNDPSLLDDDERSKLTDALQFDRDEWIQWFKIIDDWYADDLARRPEGEAEEPLNQYKHKDLDDFLNHLASTSPIRDPELSTRMDLQARYVWRQWVRSRSSEDAYDPANPKKVNDGIDLDLYKYLILPAFVVADERGFHERLKDIKSPQVGWFWRAQALADAWESGKRPQPKWNGS